MECVNIGRTTVFQCLYKGDYRRPTTHHIIIKFIFFLHNFIFLCSIEFRAWKGLIFFDKMSIFVIIEKIECHDQLNRFNNFRNKKKKDESRINISTAVFVKYKNEEFSESSSIFTTIEEYTIRHWKLFTSNFVSNSPDFASGIVLSFQFYVLFNVLTDQTVLIELLIF